MMRISLREIMILVFGFALALAGLTAGGWVASFAIALVLVLTTAMAIVALVGQGRWVVFAKGFLIAFLFYAAPHIYVGSSELDPYGKLPSTRLWGPVYERLVRRQYFDIRTGEPLPYYDPTENPASAPGVFGISANITARESPDRATFMLLAHAVAAVVFAYCGGKFALWIHDRGLRGHRQERTASKPAGEPAGNTEPPAE
ncbi:MAG: hypothetical protein KatS3mg082_2022 [Nitrospiraceae bacterium]|nr:MAG: hypothetical protein KatS3mg082_2022 [Nitrospiraceae bacterium]